MDEKKLIARGVLWYWSAEYHRETHEDINNSVFSTRLNSVQELRPRTAQHTRGKQSNERLLMERALSREGVRAPAPKL